MYCVEHMGLASNRFITGCMNYTNLKKHLSCSLTGFDFPLGVATFIILSLASTLPDGFSGLHVLPDGCGIFSWRCDLSVCCVQEARQHQWTRLLALSLKE